MAYYFVLSLFLLSSCVNKRPATVENKVSVNNEDSVLRINDTTLSFLNYQNRSLRLIDFRYVRFGYDSGRSNLARFFHDKFDRNLYNFETDENKNLVYQTNGDTVLIKIYFSTRDRRYLYEPDEITFKNGTIYLKEKYSKLATFQKTYGITLDEVIYKFISLEDSLPRFRHLWKL
jgi:hypothetical protein